MQQTNNMEKVKQAKRKLHDQIQSMLFWSTHTTTEKVSTDMHPTKKANHITNKQNKKKECNIREVNKEMWV